MSAQNKLIRDPKESDDDLILRLVSWITAFFLIFLVFAFFKGWLQNFYINVLFGFYAITRTMWVSVVLLGVFQTFLMVPFRFVRVALKHNTARFQKKVDELKEGSQQIARVRKNFHQGNLTFLFYVVDFMVQLTLFISIGRLFLTDFYNNQLDPSAFLKWIPYPEYPLQGLFFKLPYPYITQQKDLGWWVVLIVWALILLGHVFFYLGKRIQKRFEIQAAEAEARRKEAGEVDEEEAKDEEPVKKKSENKVLNILGGSTIVLFIIAYFVVRHWPLEMELRIFSGDVSQPNQRFNTVTAIVTFITFAWFGVLDLYRQGKLAAQKGIPKKIIDSTQQEMFRDAIFNSALIGLAAYYITNLIPSAFELSIFTFEVIALLSPFTLDKFVFKIQEEDD